jgi:hypothetical protein
VVPSATAPGLFDVLASAGSSFTELTAGQVASLEKVSGWMLDHREPRVPGCCPGGSR